MIPRYSNFKIFSLAIFLFLATLIWEPIIFFFPLILFEIIENNIETFDSNFFKIILSFVPSLIVALIIIFDPLTDNEHELMALILKNEFDQDCYMSCGRLRSLSTIIQQFQENNERSIQVFIRYPIIILIESFFPLVVLLNNSRLKNEKLFLFKNLKKIHVFYILQSMGFAGADKNVISALIYFQLLIKNFLILDFEKLRMNFIYKINRKTFIIFFIIFSSQNYSNRKIWLFICF